jgi:L-threonylcarbamoyladenylate synthase
MARLRAVRHREPKKTFTIHLARPDAAELYVGPLADGARRIVRKLWPGPVALTFDVPPEQRQAAARTLEIAETDIFDGDRLTLRCPSHPVARDVIEAAEAPVVVSLAGGDAAAARQVDQFLPAVAEKVDLVLDAGAAQFAKPSTIVHVRADGSYQIERAGIYDDRIIDRLMRTTVLFVCSGNTCRSPMAEALARKILADRLGVPQDQLEQKGFSVLSAGAYALPGAKATPAAVEAVGGMGADLTRHRSRMLTPELVNQADLIFTMGRSHRDAVMALSPAAAGKVHTLDPEKDIEDPIGGDASLYRELAVELERLIAGRLDEVVPGH